MGFSFRPPAWSWFALVPALGLLTGLGFWQVDRGRDKASLMGTLEAASSAPPAVVEEVLDRPATAAVVHVVAEGRFDPDHPLLLDNQGQERRPGYHVWSPFELASGRWIVVDRGWVAWRERRELAREVGVEGQPRTLTGFWRSLPEPGLRLGEPACDRTRWPVIVQYPTAAELGCLLERPVADGLLLLDPAEPDGYRREWSVGVEVPPVRHYAYAAQWFAFAATLLVLFLRWSLKRDG